MLGLLLAAGTALACSGCGQASSTEVVGHAAVVTQSLPGARLSLKLEAVSPGRPGAVVLQGDGVLSNAPPAADVRLDVSGLLGRAGGTRFFELRTVKDTIYLGFASLGVAPGGRHWLEINPAREAATAGLAGLPVTNELDPGLYLAYLRAAAGSLASIGLQTLDGVPTSGYRGEIDLERVASEASAARRAASIAAVGNLERVTGVHSIPFQVWIDAAGRIRRMSFVEGEAATEAGAEKVYVTVDLRGFGVEHPRPAPARGDVLDVSSAAGAALAAEFGLKRVSTARRGAA
jgi:hypothetical protein